MRKFLKKFKAKVSGSKQQNIPQELKASNVFCMLPWVHLHALPGGNLYPCCSSAHLNEAVVGNLNKGESLISTWNGERLKKIRLKMLAGEKLRICEKCYADEDRNQESQRLASFKAFPHHLSKALKTKKSGSVAYEEIPYLDIRFSNLCNLRCRICSHDYSTSWYKDQKALWPEYTKPRKINVSDNLDELWKQLEPHMNNLERIHFAGGEPMIMEEHYLILKRLHDLRRFDVHLSYNTNFTIRYFKKHDIFKLWKDFNHIFVAASLDGSGKRGEYLRKNMNWHQTEQLRKEMIEICPNVRFRLDPTVSIHNVFHLPDFYDDWHKKELMGNEGMRINILYEPEEYNIVNLPNSIKEKVKTKYESFLKGHTYNEQVQTQFGAVLSHMFSQESSDTNNFKKTTEKLDKLRDESFLETFPELKEMMNE